MKRICAVVAVLLFFAVAMRAEMTNELSDKEIQGQMLAGKIWSQRPFENASNTGVLRIRNAAGDRLSIPIRCEVIVKQTELRDNGFPTNWYNLYEAHLTNGLFEMLEIARNADSPNKYLHHEGSFGLDSIMQTQHGYLATNPTSPFAHSDFWIVDLGLEFLHWPDQKVLRREVHSSRGCTVLESTNPNPSANGYSRVVSWIDTETLGIVEAYAYDAKGKELKIFTPKDFKKVNGQWQVQTFVMENVQTGSRSRLEFDLKK